MRINRFRSALKPGQDFCQASCQKTCPYGHKESEDCHSFSASSNRMSILFLSIISPPSARIYKGTAVWRLSSFSPGKFCELRDFAYGQNLCILLQDLLLQKPKDSSWSMPLSPHRGRMIAFATAVRSGHSALRGPLDSSFAGI